jgi:serine/threonine protein kinase
MSRTWGALQSIEPALPMRHARPVHDLTSRPKPDVLSMNCEGSGRMPDGSTIGAYRILDVLGQGGMGVVYRARHQTSSQIVALKTVKVPTPRWHASIRREVQALTRIRHPGVVRILDHGVHEGRPWYTMDLLEGETLRSFGYRIWSRFRRSTPPPLTEALSFTENLASETVATADRPIASRWRETAPAGAGELPSILRIFRRLCATLAFLHGEGLINCDLKPENVLLVGMDPVLIDFGLTTRGPRGGREMLESQRSLAGTVPYMSPEHIRSEFPDARSDLYSAGCMLYEMVTGQPPFTGVGILAKHLREPVRPPSELVSHLPSALERVILRLLEKDLSRRFGYADEVAAELATLAEDERVLDSFPPVTSYLYRSRFVGRDPLMTTLHDARERAVSGTGALILLAGESGAGKTRIAMELTRIAPALPLRVLTSEASSVAARNAEAIAAEPLHVLRPVLQAIADQCQEEGPDATERLLGPARCLLVPYEPLLAQVPAREASQPLLPLAAEPSRKRLFEALGAVLQTFAREVPLLWIIDDLGWADELSLSFLRSLDPAFFANTPVLILGTYRSEESTAELERLVELPHVQHYRLERLGHSAVRSMMSDMLALPQPADDLVLFVTREAEGNPFFVAEYLRAAVSAQILFRDMQYSWQVAGDTLGAPDRLASLTLPGTLRELIEQRLLRLSPVARRMALAASVLGREADTDVLCEVAALDEDASLLAIDELLRRELLTYHDLERVRFVHDKLREVAYAQLEAEEQRSLHGRAASVLEARWRAGPLGNAACAALGQHFAAARQHEKAAEYLTLAAVHARATHAHQDAIHLYRETLAQLEALAVNVAEQEARLAPVRESLADVLMLVGDRQQARAIYGLALERISSASSAAPSILRKLGKTWEMEHQHEEALSHYARAQNALGALSSHTTQALREEWIQVRIEQLWVYYWLARVADMDQLAATLEPHIGEHGSALQYARFFQVRVLANMRRERFHISEETLSYAHSALGACQDASALAELPMSQFLYAFTLMLEEPTERAAAELRRAEQLARSAGDAGLLTRCLTYLTVCSRLLRRVEHTKAYAASSHKVATAAGLREYIAAALANRGWVLLQDEDRDAADSVVREALDTWAALTLVFPFQWLALVPALEIAVARDDLQAAAKHCEALLSAKQQLLPGAATDALGRAVDTWRKQDADGTRAALAQALRQLDSRPSA